MRLLKRGKHCEEAARRHIVADAHAHHIAERRSLQWKWTAVRTESSISGK